MLHKTCKNIEKDICTVDNLQDDIEEFITRATHSSSEDQSDSSTD